VRRAARRASLAGTSCCCRYRARCRPPTPAPTIPMRSMTPPIPEGPKVKSRAPQHTSEGPAQGLAGQDSAGSPLRRVHSVSRARKSRSTSFAAGSAIRLCASAGSAARS